MPAFWALDDQFIAAGATRDTATDQVSRCLVISASQIRHDLTCAACVIDYHQAAPVHVLYANIETSPR